MNVKFRPNLAATAPNDLSGLRFPMFASYKLDGIRAVVLGGVVYSRSMKPIPNKHVQKRFGKPEYEGLDGELIIGNPSAKDVFKVTTSGVMSHEGEPDVVFHVFDYIDFDCQYIDRLNDMYHLTYFADMRPLRIVDQTVVTTVEGVLRFEQHALAQGYEGVMLRSISGMYKQGRSTLKEQGIVKVKRFTDAEGEIVGMVPLKHNHNAKEVSEVGLAKRSTKKAGKVESSELMGALVVRMADGVEVEVGTGFTEHDRRELFTDWESLSKGYVCKFKYFEPGTDQKPRHPVFLGLRAKEDLG